MRQLRVGDRVRAHKYPARWVVGTVVEVRPLDCMLPEGTVTVAWDDPELGESWFSSQYRVWLLPEDYGAGM